MKQFFLHLAVVFALCFLATGNDVEVIFELCKLAEQYWQNLSIIRNCLFIFQLKSSKNLVSNSENLNKSERGITCANTCLLSLLFYELSTLSFSCSSLAALLRIIFLQPCWSNKAFQSNHTISSHHRYCGSEVNPKTAEKMTSVVSKSKENFYRQSKSKGDVVVTGKNKYFKKISYHTTAFPRSRLYYIFISWYHGFITVQNFCDVNTPNK